MHSLDTLLEEFDRGMANTLRKSQHKGMKNLMRQAYTLGEKEGQARMNNSGRLLFQQGFKEGAEQERKKLGELCEKMKENPGLKSFDNGNAPILEIIESQMRKGYIAALTDLQSSLNQGK